MITNHKVSRIPNSDVDRSSIINSPNFLTRPQPCSIHYVTKTMQKALLPLAIFCLLALTAGAQVKKHYQITDKEDYSEVHFTFTSASGSCKISPTNHQNPVNIYGIVNDDATEPAFSSATTQSVNFVDMKVLKEANKTLMAGFGNFFGGADEEPDNKWKIFLAQGKPFDLNLQYGMGDATIDLSGIAVKNLDITTGSADVRVGYHNGFYNKVVMDTFAVKVDMGNVTVDHMEQARAKHVIADVGFGNCTLDFGKDMKEASNITAFVGAGNLIVLLSETEAPIKIVIQNSPLCHVQMPDTFQKLEGEENIWVNESYRQDSDLSDATVFTLDVAMGQILFKEK